MRDLTSSTFLPTTTMSSLPDLREFDNADLAESLSDSEEFLSLKFKERMRRKRERWAREERERREREEREREERERREREEREARDRAEREAQEAREAQSQEERERSAREEVRRGKVSAGRLKRRRPRGVTNRTFLSSSVRRRWTRKRSPPAIVVGRGARNVSRGSRGRGPVRNAARSRRAAAW